MSRCVKRILYMSDDWSTDGFHLGSIKFSQINGIVVATDSVTGTVRHGETRVEALGNLVKELNHHEGVTRGVLGVISEEYAEHDLRGTELVVNPKQTASQFNNTPVVRFEDAKIHIKNGSTDKFYRIEVDGHRGGFATANVLSTLSEEEAITLAVKGLDYLQPQEGDLLVAIAMPDGILQPSAPKGSIYSNHIFEWAEPVETGEIDDKSIQAVELVSESERLVAKPVNLEMELGEIHNTWIEIQTNRVDSSKFSKRLELLRTKKASIAAESVGEIPDISEDFLSETVTKQKDSEPLETGDFDEWGQRKTDLMKDVKDR